MTSVRRIEAELHRKEFGMLGQVGRGATGDPSLFGRKSTSNGRKRPANKGVWCAGGDKNWEKLAEMGVR